MNLFMNASQLRRPVSWPAWRGCTSGADALRAEEKQLIGDAKGEERERSSRQREAASTPAGSGSQFFTAMSSRTSASSTPVLGGEAAVIRRAVPSHRCAGGIGPARNGSEVRDPRRGRPTFRAFATDFFRTAKRTRATASFLSADQFVLAPGLSAVKLPIACVLEFGAARREYRAGSE